MLNNELKKTLAEIKLQNEQPNVQNEVNENRDVSVHPSENISEFRNRPELEDRPNNQSSGLPPIERIVTPPIEEIV